MSWNYRVIEKDGFLPRELQTYKNEKVTFYEIHEVYYDNEGNITMFSADPISPYGDDLDDLAKDLEKIKEALKKPVLKYSDISSKKY